MALARNSLFSLTPTIAGVAVSILTVPLYISLAGAERYGALLIAWVLLGYFGQADFGLGRAITQRLSSMPGAGSVDRAAVVWSAAVGAALVYIAAQVFFGSFFDAEASLKAEALASTWLFALCVPVIMYTGVSAGALTGLERFGIVSIGTTIGNLLSQILPLLVALFHSVELSWLLAASLVGRVIGLLPVMVSMWLVFLRGQPVNPSLVQLRRLFSFGVWIMVTAIIGPLMTASDRVVIGGAIGPAAVVAYSVPFQIAQRTVMLPMAVVQALFPRLASHTAEQAATLGKDAVVLVGQMYAFVVIGLICLAEPLLRMWLGDGLDQRSILVGQIALIGFWVNALANVPYAHLHARGNSRFTALVHLAELPLYCAMLYGFGIWLGLAGIALAFSLRALIDCVIMFAKARFVQGAVLLKLATPAVLIVSALLVAPLAENWLLSLLAASILAGVLLPVCWIQMPEEAKRAVVAKFSQ
jgi:O-antigen/teichoic acid export membrane protein